MRIALRWKIALTFTLLTAVVLAALGAYLNALVVNRGVEIMRQGLVTEAHVLERQLAPPWRPSAGLQQRLVAFDRLAEARLTLIDAEGRVVGDSRDNPVLMGNHADRPERLEAIGEGTGSAIRFSETLRQPMLYVAVAVAVGAPGASPRAVLRLARPMTEVRAASRHLSQVLFAAFAAAAALVWLASLLLAGSLAAPLQTLVRVARRVDRGDLQARAEGVHGPDLGELAAVFNSALDSLGQLVSASQREGRYYAAILRQMSDAVVIVDRAGRAQFTNPTFTRLFGVHPETPGQRASDEVALNYELSSLLARAVEQGAEQRSEVRLLYPEARTLAATVTPLCDEAGAVLGAIALLRDVTDLHRLDDVRREFVANASHELRTPAAAVKALAEALQLGALKDPEKGPRFVQQIVDAADRQTGILDDMLTLTRVERGSELLTPGLVRATEAFEEAACQIRPAAVARGVDLRTEAAAEDQLTADPGGLHTMLLNLLDNAVKYTPAGGSVVLRGRPVPGAYEITVTDTGIGIPPEHQGRIFERFYRVDKARDRATGGTGLGLSIVKHLAEAHGGKVAVRSAEGEGSTFTLVLPHAPA